MKSKDNFYIIDGRNNNKVIASCSSQANVKEFIDNKEAEEGEDAVDDLSVITSEEMEERAHIYGSRVRTYYN